MINDARALAASLVRQSGAQERGLPFFCYGTAATAVVGIGRKYSFKMPGITSLDVVWAAINDFFRANAGQYIVGFIGFDPSNELHNDIAVVEQKVDLFVPATVIECSRSGYSVKSGEFSLQSPLNDSVVSPAAKLEPAGFDRQSYRSDYSAAVGNVLDAIRSGEVERLTLARRIEVDRALDLAATFLSEGSRHECARNFHFNNEFIRFAGQSPELLAEGDIHSFFSHKLSGTYRKDGERRVAELSKLFVEDERIRAEHHSSIAAIEKSLATIGAVEVRRFQVMELPTLLHGWSEFTTRPAPHSGIADCLRAVFPYGVQPLEAGLALLKKNETFLRGPYYGLVGCIQPGGHFSFTQVLRAVFADDCSNYLIAGAAITRHSTPELEVAETCAKLSGVQLFEMP